MRMPCKPVKKDHIADTGLISSGTYFLERRESLEQRRYHTIVSLFTESYVHNHIVKTVTKLDKKTYY